MAKETSTETSPKEGAGPATKKWYEYKRRLMLVYLFSSTLFGVGILSLYGALSGNTGLLPGLNLISNYGDPLTAGLIFAVGAAMSIATMLALPRADEKPFQGNYKSDTSASGWTFSLSYLFTLTIGIIAAFSASAGAAIIAPASLIFTYIAGKKLLQLENNLSPQSGDALGKDPNKAVIDTHAPNKTPLYSSDQLKPNEAKNAQNPDGLGLIRNPQIGPPSLGKRIAQYKVIRAFAETFHTPGSPTSSTWSDDITSNQAHTLKEHLNAFANGLLATNSHERPWEKSAAKISELLEGDDGNKRLEQQLVKNLLEAEFILDTGEQDKEHLTSKSAPSSSSHTVTGPSTNHSPGNLSNKS